MPSDVMLPDLEVHLPGLREVPDMFDRQAAASQRCRDHAEDAYGAMDYGPGPLRNATAGIINYLAGTHDRIRGEVIDYFDDVHQFATTQGASVQESVELYETTDMEIAAMLDASMFQPARREEVAELGRSTELDPQREMASNLEQKEPTDALKPFTDYRAEIPFQPDWVGGGARDTIWQVTYVATQLGLLFTPPTNLLEVVRLVFVLLDLVQLGIEAVWDFEARVELGLLHGPQADVPMPEVPAPSTGYY